jgi:hypothetical protein
MTSHQGVPYSNARLPTVAEPSGASYPDAYRLAINLARSFGASTIVDIGFAAPRELMAASEYRWIIVDRDLRPMTHRVYFPNETWIDWDWPADRDIPIADETLERAVVVCAGVIADIRDPTGLLAFLKRASLHASAIIVCTPERELQDLNSAEQQHGSRLAELPRNPTQSATRLSGWNLAEFKTLLEQNDLRPTFIGLTINNDYNLQKNSIIAIIDGCPLTKARLTPDDFRPLVLTSTFNDVDIALEIVQKLLEDGMDVIVYDNWSDDGTFEQLAALASTRDDLSVVRFPEGGPSKYFELSALLRLKEEIAAAYPGRWIIHHDSDEIRCSPWPDLSLRQGIYLVDLMGFTAVDFTVCGFRPIDGEFAPGRGLERHIRHFEFSNDRADFIQAKAWRQSTKPVGLAHTAGHDAYFPERRIFPYKFLLKHYPLRSPSQARRKIFVERRPRFAPEERKAGWHYHYDTFDENDSYIWNAAELIDFEAPATRFRFLVETISGIGIVRDQLKAQARKSIGFGATNLPPPRPDHLPSVSDDAACAQQKNAVLLAIAAASDRFREDATSSENNSREELTRLKGELQAERDRVAAVKTEIQREHREELALLKSELQAERDQIAAMKAEIQRERREELTRLEAEAQAERDQIVAMKVEIQRERREELTRLEAEAQADRGRIVAMKAAIRRERREQLTRFQAEVQAERDQIVAMKAAIKHERREELARLKAEVQAERDQIVVMKTAIQRASHEELAHLRAEAQTRSDQIVIMKTAIRRGRIARYRHAVESSSPRRLRRQRDLIADSGWFDVTYYLEQNPDVRSTGVDPVTHYVEWGAAEGRNPSLRFDGDSYLDHYPDVLAAGANPLVHYLKYGMAEGRKIKPVD